MNKHLLVTSREHCFVGDYFNYQDKILYIKQSEKSEILLSVPIQYIDYIITVSGNQYTSIKDIEKQLMEFAG